jgi:ADP-ribose pyrophosphatase
MDAQMHEIGVGHGPTITGGALPAQRWQRRHGSSLPVPSAPCKRRRREDRMAEQDVEIFEKTSPFRGYFRIDRYRLRHRRHDGGWTGEITREVFERGHAAAVLLYDPDRDAVGLIEQFRVSAMAAGESAWQIETVAGIIEEGESPEDVVRREAIEEADATVLDLVPIAKYLVSPGGTTETCALYCGRVDSRGLGGHFGLAEEEEDIRVFVLPTDEALAMLGQPQTANAVTIIALQWLALNRHELKRRWSSDRSG